MNGSRRRRRMPVGAEVVDGAAHFRVWAPGRTSVSVVVEGRGRQRVGPIPLGPGEDGYFSGSSREIGVGGLYRYRLDGEGPFPDPASRFQPEGPHGPSQVVDPGSFAWSDGDWAGPVAEEAILYEMHVGTFTREGTWDAAIPFLEGLARLGITILEVMPVADFPGKFGWGYDGVDLFAPTRLYGEPDAMRRFVDAAHRAGLAVILDVGYSHLGPEGNYLKAFSPAYFTDRYETEWGEPFNFDGEDSGPVRELILANAGYWVDEFHVDGLRLDATQSIFDRSPRPILSEIARTVREAAGGRRTYLVGENEPQEARLVRPLSSGGFGLDAVWGDDFHHSTILAATGRREGYYSDYLGTPQEIISACKHGYLYQGQYNPRQGKRRGSRTAGIPRSAFVNYLQNHDQIANSTMARRWDHFTSPGRCRALTALLLLGPGAPFLFQGQEFAATTPFHYFGDLEERLAEETHRGRKSFVTQFASQATEEVQRAIPRPNDPETFARSKLDRAEDEQSGRALALHADLLGLRRGHRAFRNSDLGGFDGAVIGPEAFVLRWEGGDNLADARLLFVNLGPDLRPVAGSEPLLAPTSPETTWGLLWSSEDPRYGGGGTPPVLLDEPEPWRIPGQCAVALEPRRSGPEPS